MGSIQRLRAMMAVGSALVLLLLPTAALGELAKWDQARVTQIAEELAAAMKDLRQEIQAAPAITDPTRQRARYEALEDVRIMTNSSTHLASELKAGKGRLSYIRGPALEEWYLNSPWGLEQGFTIASAPAPSDRGGDLVLEMVLSGSLQPWLKKIYG